MNKITRRNSLKGIGIIGSSPFLFSTPASARPGNKTKQTNLSDCHREIAEHVFATPFIDTHEHLIEEQGRLTGTQHPRVPADDWTMLFSHYINSDFRSAGMTQSEYDRFFSPDVDPVDKWKLLSPYWPFVKNTGYGMASHLAIQELYDVPELSAETVRQVQAGYDKMRRPGFYKTILKDVCNIDSCQVNSLEGTPFMRSAHPRLLMQDLSIVNMFAWIDIEKLSTPAGIKVAALDDWLRVIDWWFSTYGPFAVAVKSQQAYSRDINYKRVALEKAEPIFAKMLANSKLMDDEQKTLQDALFWYAVNKADEYDLPVKLHTGYYAGSANMPLARLRHNAGSATELCMASPETRFVFMHINYPNYEELIAAAKNHPNCYVDMCWSWIINPVAAKDFLKKYLVTAPANKILTFGGDYIPVEPVVGHAIIARHGISLALAELAAEGWLAQADAMELIDPLMHGNAENIFNVAAKKKALSKKQW